MTGWVLGSGKSLRTTATPAQYLRLLLAVTAQPRELASDSVIPTPAALQLTSQACPSGPVAPSRSSQDGFPWLHYRYHWTSLSLASCASLVASRRRAWACWQTMAGHGMAGQGKERVGQGGSDDDGMAMGQTGPQPPRPAGCQAWPLAWASRLFQPVPTASALRCVYFQLPCRRRDWNRISIKIVQPSSAGCRQRQRSSAACLHETLRIRMSAILAGRLGI